MVEFEILSRASAFFVKCSNSSAFQSRFHLVTASHVIAPWRFPKYYPDDWLQFVNQSHTRHTIEFRDEDGFLTMETQLSPKSYHHTTRDLAVLHLDDEEQALEVFEMEGVEPQDLLKRELVEGEDLNFHGHDVAIPAAFGVDANIDAYIGEDSNSHIDSTEDCRQPKPQIVKGFFFSQSAHQFFARTNPILKYGMCGGPVTAKSSQTLTAGSMSRTSFTSSVCGMLEGIVPLESTNENIRGLASFVDSSVITE